MRNPKLLLLVPLFLFAGVAYAAPYYTYQPTLLPQSNNGYDVGTTTQVWRNAYITQLCLSADCRTAWPSGVGSGLATTSPVASSNLLYYNASGAGSATGVATTTLVQGTNITFTGGTPVVIGSTPITISASGGGSGVGTVATSSLETKGGLPYFTSTSGYPATLGQVATTTLTGSGVVSISNAPVLIGASPAVATITGGANGQILGWLSGIPTWTATTTFSSPLLYASGNVSCQTASGSLAGCLSSADWTTFNGKQGAITLTTTGSSGASTLIGNTLNIPQYSGGGAGIGDPFTHPAAGQSATTSLMLLFGQASTSQFTATSSVWLATSGGNVAIGTNTPSKIFHVYGNQSGGIARFERRTAGVSGTISSPSLFGTQDVAFSDTGTGHDFLGPTQTFSFIDSAGTVNTLGQIGAIRTGADNTGNFDIYANNAGVANAIFTVAGNSVVAVGSSSPSNNTASCGNAGFCVVNQPNSGPTTAEGQIKLISGTSTDEVRTFLNARSNTTPQRAELGTETNNPLYFYTNNTFRGLISAAGLFGLGTTTPTQVLSVQGSGLFSGDVAAANLTATGTVTFSGVSNGCLNIASGVVGSTGVACASSGGGTYPFTPTANFGLTMSATSTAEWNTQGLFASSTSATRPALAASNTSGGPAAIFAQGKVGIASSTPYTALGVVGTSTFNGEVVIGGDSSDLPNPYLLISTSTNTFFGRVPGDVIDAQYGWNGQTSINVINQNQGSCASATFFADGNNPTLGGYYGTFSFLNDGWTGSGCSIGAGTAQKAEAVVLANPTGEMDFVIASTTNNGYADFNWFANTNTQLMKLTNAGLLGIGSTSPLAQLSIQSSYTASSTPELQINTIGSSTPSLYVDSPNNNGYVGIGTTSPHEPFTVHTQGAIGATTFVASFINSKSDKDGNQRNTAIEIGSQGFSGGLNYADIELAGNSLNFYTGGSAQNVLANKAVTFSTGGFTAFGGTNISSFQIASSTTDTIHQLQVDNSTASAANGLLVKTSAAGSAVALSTQSTSANDGISVNGKGTGANTFGTLNTGATTIGNATGATTINSASTLNIDVLSVSKIALTNFATSFAQSTSNTAATTRFLVTAANDTALTASAEAPEVYFNMGSRTHATGAIATQRDFRITGTTHAFNTGTNAANTIASSSSLSIDGPPGQGALLNYTNAYGLFINKGGTYTAASTTNAIGLAIEAPTGATNNYAASTTGSWVMNGITVSSSGDALCHNATTNVLEDAGGATCVVSSKLAKHDILTIRNPDEVLQLRPVEYTLNDSGERRYGFIADEAALIDPKLVEFAKTDVHIVGADGKPAVIKKGQPLTFDYIRYTGLLTAEVQKQQKEIENIKVGNYVRPLEENYQDILIGLLILYVLYNEFSKRRK